MQIRMGKFKEFKFKERLFKYGLRETERYKADIFLMRIRTGKKTEYVSFEFSPKKQSRLCIGEHGKRVYCRQGSLKKGTYLKMNSDPVKHTGYPAPGIIKPKRSGSSIGRQGKLKKGDLKMNPDPLNTQAIRLRE